MILTVDIGNSRIKCALWQSDVILARGAVAYSADSISQAFEQLLLTGTIAELSVVRPSQVLAVCVAGEAVKQALSEWMAQHWHIEVHYLRTEKQYLNIRNAYDDPGKHGADRWAAAIAGAGIFSGSAVCVICAGTAITFDVINKDGQHLGGYILPSYVTMHAALLADTADVGSVLNMQFDKNNNTIPNNTDDAVNEGLHRLLQAGVREICSSLQTAAGGTMQIVITGGFAETILSYPGMPAMHYRPDLVMQGLYDIMWRQKAAQGN